MFFVGLHFFPKYLSTDKWRGELLSFYLMGTNCVAVEGGGSGKAQFAKVFFQSYISIGRMLSQNEYARDQVSILLSLPTEAVMFPFHWVSGSIGSMTCHVTIVPVSSYIASK
jgi:hypothetical protein